MIKKKTVYETDDGKLHSSRDAAREYEELLELIEYVNENPIYTTHTPDNKPICNGQQLALWLKDHPRIYMKFLPLPEAPLVETMK